MATDPHTLTIHAAQLNQPWTVPYSDGVNTATTRVPHILGSHCVLHATKSVGKLAAVFEALDHAGGEPTREQFDAIRDMSADLVTAALRFANLYGFDLSTRFVKRVEDKNRVTLTW